MTSERKNYFSIWFKNAYQPFVRCLSAMWLMVGYIVPNSILSIFTPLAILGHLNLTSINAHNVNLVYLIVFSLTASYWFLVRQSNEGKAIWCLVSVYVGTLVLTGLFSGVQSDLIINCLLIVVPLSFGLLSALAAREARCAVRAVCLLGLIQAIYTILYMRSGINVLYSGTVARAGGTFGYPDGVYTVMIVCLPLAIGLFFDARHSLEKGFWLFAASFLFAALLLTWYRGGILGASFGLFVIFNQLVKKGKAQLITTLLMILICCIVALHRVNGEANRISSQGSIRGRVRLWHRGWNIFEEHWITGVGIGALQLPVNSKSHRNPNITDYQIGVEPKNIFLQWLDEMGIGGGILFSLFIIYIYKTLTKHKSSISLGVGGAWVALLVAGLFDTPFGIGARPFGNLLVGMLLGMTMLISLPYLTPADKIVLDEANNKGYEPAI